MQDPLFIKCKKRSPPWLMISFEVLNDTAREVTLSSGSLLMTRLGGVYKRVLALLQAQSWFILSLSHNKTKTLQHEGYGKCFSPEEGIGLFKVSCDS